MSAPIMYSPGQLPKPGPVLAHNKRVDLNTLCTVYNSVVGFIQLTKPDL